MLREYNEIKKENKNAQVSLKYTIQKQQKPIVSVVRKMLQTKILVLEELNKIDLVSK